jgi:predicted nucleic acid-binding protein
LVVKTHQAALPLLRLWPADEQTAAELAEQFQELRSAGRAFSQFDLLIAATARQYGLILLTADQDFQAPRRPAPGASPVN